jgi:hypothetical protein
MVESIERMETEKAVGSSTNNWGKEYASWGREEQVREQDREQVGEQDEISRLIEFCSIPRSRSEMMEFLE